MSKLAAFASSNGALVGGAGVLAVAVIGAGFVINGRAAPEQTAPVVQTAIEAAVAPDVVADPAPEAPSETPDIVTNAPPSIDEVRLEPDGLTIIAGRAAPGSEVSVLVDGAKNSAVTTGPGGSFAAITTLPTSTHAQVLSVVQRLGEDEIASIEDVIIAPRAAPAPVAVAQDPAQPADNKEETQMVAVADTGDADIATTDTNAGAVAQVDAVPEATAQVRDPVEDAPQAADPDADKTPAPVDVAETQTTGEDVAVAQTEPDPAPLVADTPAPEAEVTQADTTPPAPDQPANPAPPVVAATADPAPQAPEVVASAAEPTAPAVLRSTAEGVEVLNTTRPDVLENIELDTISYSLEGDVQLAGRAQIESEVVRVYVNNRPIADLDVDENGEWRGALPQIDTGVYTLRVDELNDAGDVTSRVETPFRREDPAVLAQNDDASAPASRVTVQAGNSLWAIARERYGEGRLYVQLFEANRGSIRNPDLIFPGQVFDVPN